MSELQAPTRSVGGLKSRCQTASFRVRYRGRKLCPQGGEVPYGGTVPQAGADMEPRNSLLDFDLVSRLRSNSIASTVDKGLNTLRRTQTRLSSSGGRSSSSLRVPER